MTKDPEIFIVPASMDHVACNGVGGALGHPKVYYTFHDQDSVTCGYCDRVFTKIQQDGGKPYLHAG